MLVASMTAGCSSASQSLRPADAPNTCTTTGDTAKVPLNDLGTGCYLGFQGGLYPGGADSLPEAHLAAGRAAAKAIQPLDAAGQPAANGRYVLLSIGMSNTTQEFCSDGGLPGSCQPFSFMGQAAADPTVNHSTLVIVNGAYGGRAASSWVSQTSPEYDRIHESWLAPLGLTERQVQIAWIKVADPDPTVSLPASTADAYTLEAEIGSILRALKARYPNLRQAFLTSRIYAGYATSPLNPEPYAYESGFSVKWAVQSQIDQTAGRANAGRTGDVRYDDGSAPWIAWGPYPWAAGMHARSDGLAWVPTDFASDGTHPAASARQKVGAMLLGFFKTSPVTRCWFLAAMSCG